jgi:tetratricopeptide (TPR) repeat protein
MRPTKDPTPWIQEAEATTKQLMAENQDKLFRARIDWMMGEAYQYALRVEHTRGDAGQASLYGNRAIDHLSAGAEPRTSSPEAEQTVGRLYFYLGAINAVHKEDHAEAVGWYDKARPILTAERPKSEFVVPRREGESLVSMAVSYWQQDQRELAVELTTEGARLMERGVASGVLEEPALAVPYGNLATMHRRLGNRDDATEYGKLARVAKGPEAKEPKASVAKRPTNSTKKFR